jgi:phage I-like protein
MTRAAQESQAVQAVLTTQLAQDDAVPADIQYMPPGKHRIRASRSGNPVTLDITVDPSTATTLNTFLQAQLAKASTGSEDRPFFDFNHEDREAAAWPTQFYWAGDDPLTGGVRAKVEWSGAGKTAIEQKTFRRFSPTFIPNEHGHVIGSETNMGGLVNRAAFKSIQPLFAREADSGATAITRGSPSFMKTLLDTLKEHQLIESTELSEAETLIAVKASLDRLQGEKATYLERISALESEQAAAVKARATSQVEAAVQAGRIPPADTEAKAFWTDALMRDEAKAVKALEALPANPVLQPVTAGSDPKAGALDKMAQQQKALASVQAANPGAPFDIIFTKAQAENPGLFS